MNPVYGVEKITDISLELDLVTSGRYKFSWGYEFYHLANEGNKYKVDLGQFIENDGSEIIPAFDWSVVQESVGREGKRKLLNRYSYMTYPKYFIPDKLNIDYNEETEVLVVDVPKYQFTELFKSLVIANNNTVLERYFIDSIKIYAYIPTNTTPNFNTLNIFEDVNNDPNKSVKIKDDHLDNVIIFSSNEPYTNEYMGLYNIKVDVYPPLPWDCNTNIEKYGRIVLKLPYPKKKVYGIFYGLIDLLK